MKRRSILGLTVVTAVAAAGCAASPPPAPPAPQPVQLPPLRLAPAALGSARHALSQRLSVTRLDRPEAAPQQVEVQLQLDASQLLLAGFAFGQRVLLMRWDGEVLQVQRHQRLPAEVDTDRMLRDLCLVFWPAPAIRAALPPGWSWTEVEQGQALQWHALAWLTVVRSQEGRVEIINRAEGYCLVIESEALEAT